MKINIGSLSKEPYHIINLCFAGIILLIFMYSGIFSADKNNYPIKSACEIIKGEPCPSTGLSRSFSEIVRFKFNSAKEYNKYGLSVFAFFLIQFILRALISILIIFKKIRINKIVMFDSILSVCLYVYCFKGILFNS